MTATIPLTKSARQQQIVDILGRHPVRSQTELSEVLKEAGVHVTQATLSRDLVELDAVKVRTPPASSCTPSRPRAGTARPSSRTPRPPRPGSPGCSASCSSPPKRRPTSSCCGPRPARRSSWRRRSTGPSPSDVLGTMAGDDTVLVISRRPDGGDALAARFLALANGAHGTHDDPRSLT